jgi:hypothetical protein
MQVLTKCALCIALVSLAWAQGGAAIHDLRCENVANPRGVKVLQPHVTWIFDRIKRLPSIRVSHCRRSNIVSGRFGSGMITIPPADTVTRRTGKWDCCRLAIRRRNKGRKPETQLRTRRINQVIPKTSSSAALDLTRRVMVQRRSSIQIANPRIAITISSEIAAPPRTYAG